MQTFQVGRYCLPMEPEGKNTVDELLMSTESIFRRMVGDLALVSFTKIYLTLPFRPKISFTSPTL